MYGTLHILCRVTDKYITGTLNKGQSKNRVKGRNSGGLNVEKREGLRVVDGDGVGEGKETRREMGRRRISFESMGMVFISIRVLIGTMV